MKSGEETEATRRSKHVFRITCPSGAQSSLSIVDQSLVFRFSYVGNIARAR